MRPRPYPGAGEPLDPTRNLVVLLEPARAASRPRQERHLDAAVITPILAAALLFGAGVAIGTWRTNAPTAQTVPLGTGRALTIGPATVGQSIALYPGGVADLTIPVTNPNPFRVRITSARVTGANCGDPALQLSLPLLIPAALTVPTAVTFPKAVQMAATASNDCQGQVLSVTLTQLRARR